MSRKESLTKHRYYFYKDTDGLNCQREYLKPGRGLERFLIQNKIEERRVTVQDVSEIQDLLDQGFHLVLYKMRTNFGDSWRFSRIIVMDASNTYVEGSDLIYKGTVKPAAENNIFPDQIECIQQFIVIGDPDFDQGLSQKQRGKTLKPIRPAQPVEPDPPEIEVVVRPMKHPGYLHTAPPITDEEAARRANDLMDQVPDKTGINPLLK